MVKKITYNIIERYINDYGRRYYLRELARLIKKPHQTIKPHLELLVKENILVKIERKNITEYALNFRDSRVYDYIVIAEKERLMSMLKESTLLKTLFEKLSSFFNKNTFVVFGSVTEKISTSSDIDLLVIGNKNISEVIKDFEDIYNKKIHKIQVNDKKKLSLTLIKEIYNKHLIFNNTENIVRLFGELYEQNKLV